MKMTLFIFILRMKGSRDEINNETVICDCRKYNKMCSPYCSDYPLYKSQDPNRTLPAKKTLTDKKLKSINKKPTTIDKRPFINYIKKKIHMDENDDIYNNPDPVIRIKDDLLYLNNKRYNICELRKWALANPSMDLTNKEIRTLYDAAMNNNIIRDRCNSRITFVSTVISKLKDNIIKSDTSKIPETQNLFNTKFIGQTVTIPDEHSILENDRILKNNHINNPLFTISSLPLDLFKINSTLTTVVKTIYVPVNNDGFYKKNPSFIFENEMLGNSMNEIANFNDRNVLYADKDTLILTTKQSKTKTTSTIKKTNTSTIRTVKETVTVKEVNRITTTFTKEIKNILTKTVTATETSSSVKPQVTTKTLKKILTTSVLVSEFLRPNEKVEKASLPASNSSNNSLNKDIKKGSINSISPSVVKTKVETKTVNSSSIEDIKTIKTYLNSMIKEFVNLKNLFAKERSKPSVEKTTRTIYKIVTDTRKQSQSSFGCDKSTETLNKTVSSPESDTKDDINKKSYKLKQAADTQRSSSETLSASKNNDDYENQDKRIPKDTNASEFYENNSKYYSSSTSIDSERDQSVSTSKNSNNSNYINTFDNQNLIKSNLSPFSNKKQVSVTSLSSFDLKEKTSLEKKFLQENKEQKLKFNEILREIQDLKDEYKNVLREMKTINNNINSTKTHSVSSSTIQSSSRSSISSMEIKNKTDFMHDQISEILKILQMRSVKELEHEEKSSISHKKTPLKTKNDIDTDILEMKKGSSSIYRSPIKTTSEVSSFKILDKEDDNLYKVESESNKPKDTNMITKPSEVKTKKSFLSKLFDIRKTRTITITNTIYSTLRNKQGEAIKTTTRSKTESTKNVNTIKSLYKEIRDEEIANNLSKVKFRMENSSIISTEGMNNVSSIDSTTIFLNDDKKINDNSMTLYIDKKELPSNEENNSIIKLNYITTLRYEEIPPSSTVKNNEISIVTVRETSTTTIVKTLKLERSRDVIPKIEERNLLSDKKLEKTTRSEYMSTSIDVASILKEHEEKEHMNQINSSDPNALNLDTKNTINNSQTRSSAIHDNSMPHDLSQTSSSNMLVSLSVPSNITSTQYSSALPNVKVESKEFTILEDSKHDSIDSKTNNLKSIILKTKTSNLDTITTVTSQKNDDKKNDTMIDVLNTISSESAMSTSVTQSTSFSSFNSTEPTRTVTKTIIKRKKCAQNKNLDPVLEITGVQDKVEIKF